MCSSRKSMNEKKVSVGERAKKKTLAQAMAYFGLDDFGLGQLSEHSSDDEVVSTLDENDHLLIQLITILNWNSKDDDEDEAESKNPLDSNSASDDDALQQDIDDATWTLATTYPSQVTSLSVTMTTTMTPSPSTRLQSSSTGSSKRKRRQWSMAEKIQALAVHELSLNTRLIRRQLIFWTPLSTW